MWIHPSDRPWVETCGKKSPPLQIDHRTPRFPGFDKFHRKFRRAMSLSRWNAIVPDLFQHQTTAMKIRCITTATILALMLNASGEPVFTEKGSPEIEIRDGQGSLTSRLNSIVLGMFSIGGKRLKQTLTIRNLGNAALRNIEVRLTGKDAGRFEVTQTGKRVLSPGETTRFTIKFKSGTSGMRTARVKVLSNDSDENPFVISLSGWGEGGVPW